MKHFLFIFLLSLVSSSVAAQQTSDPLIIDASDATWGNKDAPVTIVMYSDLQCPYCQRAHKTLDEIEKKYPKQVRFVFRHFPLVFHKQAEPAARAAIAAQKQGKFREMHELIFQNYKQLRSNEKNIDNYLRGFALQLGLNEKKFLAAYRSNQSAQKVKSDIKSGTSLSVRGTPHFFINGERLVGAQPKVKFSSVIDGQLKQAKAIKGMSSKQRYQKLIAQNYKAPAPRPSVAKPDKLKIRYVPVNEDDPIWGSKRALVTMVSFSEYQCPFCAKADVTMKKLKKKYGNKLRIVYKQNPLSFHKQAEQAARAALAANKQGKFRKMHALLYENKKNFKAGDMDALMMKLAKKTGLKMGKFETDYYSDELKGHVELDQAQAKKVGARGTPGFFINGEFLGGAQSFDRFKKVIDKQLKLARKIKKREKLSGNKLYRAVVNENEKLKSEAKKTTAEAKIDKVSIKALRKLKRPFWKGKKNAKVVMHIMSDFECPFCKRASKTMDTLFDEYGHRVKFVFVNVYLPFHKNAEIAHLAAIAAGYQGKFWEMRNKIFRRKQNKLTQDLLDQFAAELGLNMKSFHRDRVSKRVKKQLAHEMKIAEEAGMRGTPNFNVNGEKIVGAKKIEDFREVLNRHLEK